MGNDDSRLTPRKYKDPGKGEFDPLEFNPKL